MKKWEQVYKKNGVTFYQPIEPIEETKAKLKAIYDKCNEVFKDKPEMFIDEKKLKENKENIFI